MKEETEMKNENIVVKIEEKVKRLDVIRRSRINASERLDGYHQKWEKIMFCFNIEAVLMIIIMLLIGETEAIGGITQSQLVLYSSIFSIYVILLQYFVSSSNYRERALKLHYNQLDIQKCRYELEALTEENTKNEYNKIIDRYQVILHTSENHRDSDYCKADKNPKWLKRHDFSIDHIVLFINYIILSVTTGLTMYLLTHFI